MAAKILAIVDGIRGDVTLTPLQAAADIVSLQGEPTAVFTVTVPEGVSEWLFNNQTRQTAFIKTDNGDPARSLPARTQLVFEDSASNCNNVI